MNQLEDKVESFLEWVEKKSSHQKKNQNKKDAPPTPTRSFFRGRETKQPMIIEGMEKEEISLFFFFREKKNPPFFFQGEETRRPPDKQKTIVSRIPLSL